MRGAILGVLVGAGLMIAVAGAVEAPRPVASPVLSSPRPVGPDTGILALQAVGTDGAPLVTVIDTRQRTMAVYRVDATQGRIKLLSVRNLQWDLQMTYFNSDAPLPQEIRSLLEPR